MQKQQSDKCPHCGKEHAPKKRAVFRTGMTGMHPQEVEVCTRCHNPIHANPKTPTDQTPTT